MKNISQSIPFNRKCYVIKNVYIVSDYPAYYIVFRNAQPELYYKIF